MWSAGKAEETVLESRMFSVVCSVGVVYSLFYFTCVLFEIGNWIKGVLILFMYVVLCRWLERLDQIVEMLFLPCRYLTIHALLSAVSLERGVPITLC